MKTPFIPTAMRCTQEQFEAIKPKLIEQGCLVKDIGNFKKYCYLVNNISNSNGLISNIEIKDINNYGRNVYEEWDEEIFLRNLGGEEIKEASIEQLYKASNDEADKWTKPTYDRGMMAATILSAMITVGYATDTIYKDAVEHTDKLIDRLNQTL